MAGEVYNSGAFYVNTDTTFVTNHRYSNGDFAHIVNLYNYTIIQDTLRFNGYYINRTGCNSYKTSYIDEVWVRTFDFSANDADTQENENTEG
jgi:rhamnogalacturonyl hydrolase YesR